MYIHTCMYVYVLQTTGNRTHSIIRNVRVQSKNRLFILRIYLFIYIYLYLRQKLHADFTTGIIACFSFHLFDFHV